MVRNRWVSNEELTEVEDLPRNNIHAIKSYKNHHWITKDESSNYKRKELLINIGFLYRVKDFRTKLYMEAHELYYKGVELFGSQWVMALFLADGDDSQRWVWNDWLANSLFHTRDEKWTVLDTRVSKRLVEFVRRARRFKEEYALEFIKKPKMLGQIQVYQFSLEGEFIESFPSINEASRQTGESATHISLVTNGKKGYKNHKFIWTKE